MAITPERRCIMVLLTGITGKSGSWLVRRLAAEMAAGNFSQPVRAVARPGSNTAVLDETGLDCTLVRGDLADPAFVHDAMQGVHTVLHTANICFSENIVQAALDAGVRRIILVHTTGIYSKYKSASAGYLEIERRIHAMASGSGVSLVILRPTMVYGTLQDGNVSVFIRMVDRLKLFPVVNGAKYPLQPVHARDLGDAYYEVLAHPEKITESEYVLSGGAPILLVDMLRTIGRYLGKRTRFVPVPYPIAYAGACVLCGLTLGRKDYRERVQRLVEPRAYPHQAATRDFGYSPMPFEAGVQGEVALYLESTGRSVPEDWPDVL